MSHVLFDIAQGLANSVLHKLETIVRGTELGISSGQLHLKNVKNIWHQIRSRYVPCQARYEEQHETLVMAMSFAFELGVDERNLQSDPGGEPDSGATPRQVGVLPADIIVNALAEDDT